MTTKEAQEFRTNKPYGLVIDLDNLKYSWFNREYMEIDHIDFDFECSSNNFSFGYPIRNIEVADKIRAFANKNKDKGMNYADETIGERRYLRVWLYNDSTFPYKGAQLYKLRMRSYEKFKSELRVMLDVI